VKRIITMKNIIVLILLLLLMGCSPLDKSTSLYNPPLSSSESAKSSKVSDFEYQLIYRDEEIEIREAFLGDSDNWDWKNFIMPPARIAETGKDLEFGHELATNCFEQLKTEKWCKQVLELKSENNEPVQYVLELESPIAGNIRLIKNDKIIWSGHINGGTGLGIHSFLRIGNEIAFAYLDSNYDGKNPNFWAKESIIITNEDTTIDIVDATDYDTAFAPNGIHGKLVYFAKKDGQEFLVFNGKKVGDTYDYAFNQYCCWDGPKIQIVGNGQLIDFFAVKNGGWYHVQAGNFDSIEQ
jgi:hypothetical protein